MPLTTRRKRALAIWLLCTVVYFLNASLTNSILTPSSSSSGVENPPGDKDNGSSFFALCNKKIYHENLPTFPTRDYAPEHGVYKWKRDLNNAIVLNPSLDPSVMYGRTGNQIQEFFRAFDMARDRNGALVMHTSRFPMDSALRELYLGLNTTEMAERFGILFYDNVEESHRSGLTTVMQEPLYHYISNHPDYNIFDGIYHRQYLIQELYQMTAREMARHPGAKGVADMCASMHAYFGNKNDLRAGFLSRGITQQYTVIHSRAVETFGPRFLSKMHEVFGVDDKAGIDLPTDLVKSILTPLGMANKTILMITDSKTQGPIQRLSSDPELGPHFQVVPNEVSTLTGDIMLAILSDVFIGNPVSTFSQYIAQARYALGIENSYLFARKKNDESEQWETFCNDEVCFYQFVNTFVPLF